jgi:hypothetical protein
MSRTDPAGKRVRRNPFLLGYARREMDLSPASQPMAVPRRRASLRTALLDLSGHHQLSAFTNPSLRKGSGVFLWAVAFPEPQIPLYRRNRCLEPA